MIRAAHNQRGWRQHRNHRGVAALSPPVDSALRGGKCRRSTHPSTHVPSQCNWSPVERKSLSSRVGCRFSQRGRQPRRPFGFLFAGRLPVEISARISCASLASLSSRRRAMFGRTSTAFLFSSSMALAASSAARRCLFNLATFRSSFVCSVTRAPISLAHNYIVRVFRNGTFGPSELGHSQIQLRTLGG